MMPIAVFIVVAIAFTACNLHVRSPEAGPAIAQAQRKEGKIEATVPPEEKKAAPPATVEEGLTRLKGQLDWVEKRLPKENEK